LIIYDIAVNPSFWCNFGDERDAAPDLCEDRGESRLGYVAAYERLRQDECPGAQAWEAR